MADCRLLSNWRGDSDLKRVGTGKDDYHQKVNVGREMLDHCQVNDQTCSTPAAGFIFCHGTHVQNTHVALAVGFVSQGW